MPQLQDRLGKQVSGRDLREGGGCRRLPEHRKGSLITGGPGVTKVYYAARNYNTASLIFKIYMEILTLQLVLELTSKFSSTILQVT